MNFWRQQLSLHDPFADPDADGKVGAMVERFGRMVARQLRSLGELRQAPLAVVVPNVGGQVHVGQQQVNRAPQAGVPGRGRVLAPRIGEPWLARAAEPARSVAIPRGPGGLPHRVPGVTSGGEEASGLFGCLV
jgi:hypothetical protein